MQMIKQGEARRESDRNDFQNNRNGGDYSQCIDIYPDKVGTIIGRGGSTIKDLQSRFRVNIKVDRNENMQSKIDVNISGNRSDVEEAVNEINNLTQATFDHKPKSSIPEPVQEVGFIDWQAAAKRCVSKNYHFV